MHFSSLLLFKPRNVRENLISLKNQNKTKKTHALKKLFLNAQLEFEISSVGRWAERGVSGVKV